MDKSIHKYNNTIVIKYHHYNDKETIRKNYCNYFAKCERTFFRKLKQRNFTYAELDYLLKVLSGDSLCMKN